MTRFPNILNSLQSYLFKVALLLLFLGSSIQLLHAQKVKDIAYKILSGGTQIEVTYSISPVSDELKYTTSLWLSIDGGTSFRGPLLNVSGDVGELKLMPTGKLSILWNFNTDVNDLGGKIAFRIDLKTDRIPIPPMKMVLYQFSPSAPIGLMLGKWQHKGYYIKLQSNLSFPKSDYEAGELGITNYTGNGYWVIGNEVKKSSHFVTAGYIHKLQAGLFLYGGAGFGSKKSYWNYTSYQPDDKPDQSGFALVKENSYAGLCTELGAIYMIKNSYPVSFGFQNINFTYWTISTGLGYKF